MNLPLELIQNIKEFSDYREAQIIQDMGIGWKTKSMEFHERWIPFVEQLISGTLHVRLFKGYMMDCIRCNTKRSLPESYTFKQEGVMNEFKAARKFATFVDLGWHPLDDFVEMFGHLTIHVLYHGPLAKTHLPGCYMSNVN